MLHQVPFTNILIIVLHLHTLILSIHCCVFKYKPEPEDQQLKQIGPEILKNYTRKNSTSNPHCTCGEITEDGPTWVLYIHIKINNKTTRVCPGTIINSNMVITSHKCLMKKNKMFVFDAWKNSGNMATAGDILLSTRPMFEDENNLNLTVYKVKKIIYRDRYGVDFKRHGNDQALDNDVAILVIGYDFNNAIEPFNLIPICLPKYQDISTNKLINRNAWYEGVRGWDDLGIKMAIKIDNRLSPILSGQTCNNLTRKNITINQDTLCLRYPQSGPTIEGGPLSIHATRFIEGGSDRAYLVGIATWVDRSMANSRHKHAYFTNVNSRRASHDFAIVKYIEKQAEKENSEWCEMPSHIDTHWPWQGFKGKFDESLNCDCGRKPKFTNPGRIIGGENATAHEFPWLVKFTTYVKVGEGWALKRCGASLINDRVILTAAHCFIEEGELNAKRFKTPFFNIIKSEYDTTLFYVHLNAHFDSGAHDTERIRVFPKKVLFHPGYPEEKDAKRLEFDIALIILNETLAWRFTKLDSEGNPQLVPICLPKPGDTEKTVKAKRQAIMAGWGLQLHNLLNIQYAIQYNQSLKGKPDLEQYPEVLQKISVPVHNASECTLKDGEEDNFLQSLTDTKICAGNFSALENIYQGDSGGPLMVENENGNIFQLGITSYVSAYTDGHLTGLDYAPIYNLTKAVQVSNYASTEAFLDYITYYSHEYQAKGCRQQK